MKKIKKLKKAKAKSFESEDFAQALDYSYVMLVAYSKLMEECSVLAMPELQIQYQKVGEEMVNLYQLIGQIFYKEIPDEK